MWKITKGAFITLLLLGPIICFFIGLGRVLAYITSVNGPWFLTFAFYIGVYFFILAMIRTFGGWTGMFLNGANNATKGLFDRQRKFRENQRAKATAEARAGNRFKSGPLRGLNSHIQTGHLLPSAIVNTGLVNTVRRPSRIKDQLAAGRASTDIETAAELLEKNQDIRAIKGDDDKVWAWMVGGDAEQIRQTLLSKGGDRFKGNKVALDQAVAEVQRAQRSAGGRVGRVAATMAQAGTGTGFDSVGQMVDSINAAAQGDRALAGRMLAGMRGDGLKSGRVDLGAAGFAKMATVMDQRYASMTGGPSYSTDEATREIMENVIDSSAPSQAVYGKPQSASQLGEAHVLKVQKLMNNYNNSVAEAQKALQSGDKETAATHSEKAASTERELIQQFGSIAGIYDAMAQASPQNARAFANQLTGASIQLQMLPPNLAKAISPDGKSEPASVQQIITSLMSAPQGYGEHFKEMRRDYATSALRPTPEQQAAAALAAQQGAPHVTGGPPGGLPPNPFNG